MRVHSILALACGISSAACSLYFEQDPGTGDGPATACDLRSEHAFIPGYPFDFAYYRDVVWPLTQRGCGSSGGCHDGRDGFAHSFEVWPQDNEPCSANWSFNTLYDHTDFINSPEESLVLAALDGRMPSHPVQPGRNSEEYAVLFSFIDRAFWQNLGGLQPSDYFDFDVFQREIQPMLDNAACTASGCHDAFTTPTNLGLYYRPGWGSAEIEVNFQIVTSYVDFSRWPEEAPFYTWATDFHGGSAVTDPAALLAWITDAFDNFNTAGN